MNTEWRVSVGEPADGIVRHAAEGDIDLVMMSTHGQNGGGSEQLGSVAMAVVSSGKTPVTIVRPPDEVACR
ncbi:MAG: universal stress protein [Chloroflexi bacterium]|nr:universal stress protein [Chloroflexota bacterium]MCH7787182.1 universal stress protein [Chloroflexota bacterium]